MTGAKATSPNWLVRLTVAAVVIAALVWGGTYALRPIAMVTPATKDTATNTVPGTVEVKAEFGIELKSDISGRIRSSDLEIGKRVHKDDVLVQIDTGDVDLEIERIKSEIVAAQRRVEVGSTLRADVDNKRDALVNLERQVKLGAAPQADYDREKRLLQQLEQRMELDEVNLKLLLETNLNSLRSKEREKSKMTITAPADGVVTTVLARVGDLIDRNSPIATLIAVGRTVEAKLSEEKFAAIKLGQKATVRFLTYGADQYNAVVAKILPAADPTTQRYTLYLDMFMPEGRQLTPGLTGEVGIIIAERPNAIVIPRRALVGEYVYVVAGGKVERRKVVKGYEGLNKVEIVTGLKEGEQVIVEQLDRFHEGDSVRTQVLSN